ncbi:DNA-dependent metalloprotease SPRTN-like [Lolium rigidum]|uniref:DNA-dependent metalloprotease SPRTN-like n=1 Tax=Lolium rigidum TaxID=89674 RepID=UPI001F5D31B3|nr:DNA-dependent metalloprotease SPRTN-like [Lolium rigidum]
MGLGADPDDDGENPDVWQLFRHYDKLYFRGVLVDAGFSVEWSQPRMKTISSFGSCSFGESNTITLYEPILKYRTNADLKNALLHLMIHAFLSVKCDAKGIWGHGPAFRGWMHALNTCSIDDRMRPTCGYCITTTHDFSPEKCGSMQGFWWKCESCGVTLLRAKKLGPPSDSCCIENVSQDATCGNMLCNWHNHKVDCGGTYVVTKSPETPGQQMVQKGRRGFLTEMSEMLRSQGATQESDSDEVQENLTVAKLKAEGKLLSQVGGRNARSPGSSSSKKASKSNMPEDFQKPIVLPATPRRKFVQQIPEYSQRTFVQPAVSQSKLKQSSRAAPERPKTRSKTSNPARKKEYACVSVWANIYESECSSGSAEPLVNKRTERRKRERERAVQITYSRSRKRIASGISSIKAQPAEEEISSQQTKSPPQSQCLKFILINAANKVVTQDPGDQFKAPAPRKGIVIAPPADQVTTQTPKGRSQPQVQRMDIVTPPADLAMTQTHGDLSVPSRRMDIAAVPPADKVMTRAPADQSQLPAPCSIANDQVVPPRSAGPLSLTPSNPSSSPDVIDISDDD